MYSAVSFFWAGMIFAISFLEAPLKFRAPGITTGLGLGIGKIVFKALNRVELVLAAVMLGILATYPTFAAWQAYLFAFVAIVLCLQTVWLLPALSRRADIVISGEKLQEAGSTSSSSRSTYLRSPSLSRSASDQFRVDRSKRHRLLSGICHRAHQ
ncbi:MAG: hypothetical protein UZ17_ACD001000309 [Acidobacteria bacterium OLB17]|nr:MAG: hypothetical protein UZ17_ACD001000309 [Acidobacteria bacterium OLB17]